MNFIRYVCNRSQELAADHMKSPLTGVQDAEFQALQLVFEVYRFFAKVLFIPAVFIKYLLTTFRILRVPAPALEIMQAQRQESNFQRKSKAAKKVGFETPQRASHESN